MKGGILMAAIAGFSLALLVFLFLFAAGLVLLLVKFIGCAVAPFLGNIVAGGMLYFFRDAFHLVHMDWSFFDAVVVALFGVPGTIFLAILALF